MRGQVFWIHPTNREKTAAAKTAADRYPMGGHYHAGELCAFGRDELPVQRGAEQRRHAAFLCGAFFFFIALGIVFDMIGIAAASGTEKEFHSMAAHKVRGAREAVWMLRNAEKVSNICNDVVGDICGIISGATGALIVANITAGMNGPMVVVISLLVTGMVSALTIGGKAAGKGVAMAFSSKVLALCGRLLSVLPFSFDAKK